MSTVTEARIEADPTVPIIRITRASEWNPGEVKPSGRPKFRTKWP